MKVSSGYDLTQLIIGSEGTLAIATEAVLRLHPRLPHGATVLVPFGELDQLATVIPRIVASGLQPSILEYIDVLTMAAITRAASLELGVAADVQEAATAYLLVVLESHLRERVEEDTAILADLCHANGGLDVYVLPPGSGAAMVEAREKAFWTAKAAGANEIIDVVVPRARIPEYLARCQEIAQAHGSFVVGCGHAGDGNVHLSVLQPDPGACHATVHGILAAGVAVGGAVSGEHGIGRAKKAHLAELEDPTKLDLMRRIKAVFDPAGILNPGAIFD